MYAILGEIEFNLLTYFDGLQATFGIDYAEHPLIGRKPRLECTGDKLDEIKIDLYFDMLYCDPEVELAKLKTAMQARSALSFVLGNGDYKGQFVITEISATSKQTNELGRLLTLEASLNLREYVEGPETASAKASAPALRQPGATQAPLAAQQAWQGSEKMGPAMPAVPEPSLPTELASTSLLATTTSAAKSALSQVSQAIALVGNAQAMLSSNTPLGAQMLTALAGRTAIALPALAQARTALSSFQKVSGISAQIKSAAKSFATIENSLHAMQNLVPGGSPAQLLTRINNVQTHAAQASSALARVSAAIATRAPLTKANT